MLKINEIKINDILESFSGIKFRVKFIYKKYKIIRLQNAQNNIINAQNNIIYEMTFKAFENTFFKKIKTQ